MRRARTFLANMVGTNVIGATNPKDAINSLSGPLPFDAIFLDYDMDEEHTGKNGFGTDVTDWITSNQETADRFRETIFVIHSLNKHGSQLMYDSLNGWALSVIKEPFAWNTMTPEKLQQLWSDYLKAKP